MTIKYIFMSIIRPSAPLLIFSLYMGVSNANPLDNINLNTPDGTSVTLLNDDPKGIITRPLRKTKERWDKKYYKDFLQFRKISPSFIGKDIRGQLKIENGPARITVYQISRLDDKNDMSLRVIITGFYQASEIALIDTSIYDMKNNVFIITSEKLETADELNTHLKYMNQQNNSITLNGYSSNWSLSKLRLKLSGTTESINNETFVKDADWLVSQLINPQWVIFIRADRNL